MIGSTPIIHQQTDRAKASHHDPFQVEATASKSARTSAPGTADPAAISGGTASAGTGSGQSQATAGLFEHYSESPASAAGTGAKASAAPKSKRQELTGIGSTLAVGRFVAAAKAVEKDWSRLTKDKRADKLCDAANAELHAVGVPAVACKVSDINTIGQFVQSDWRMDVGDSAFSQTSLSAEDAAGAADTIYHEARHAEQAHRVARYIAGQDPKLTKEELAVKAGIPEGIAKDAKEKPLSGTGLEAKEAQQFYDGSYGDGAANTQAVYSRQAEILAQARQTKDAYTFVVWLHTERLISDQTFEALKARKEELKQELINDINPINALYRALPEEADAFRVGDAVTKAYAGKSAKK